jgi:CO/xanthine dehydrogenase FAD-binding subunit
MDLISVERFRRPSGRADLAPASGEAVVAGGTWLFSEPQPGITGLIDLMTLGWEPVAETLDGLSIAATCTLAQVAELSQSTGWTARPLFRQCCEALLASFKIQSVGTIGGNLCVSLPAGALISLSVSLDARAVVWTPDGGEYTVPVSEFVLGVRRNVLRQGDVLRSVEFPAAALRGRTAFRKIALSPLGRSGTVVIGRLDEDGPLTMTVTAGTERPVVLRFPELPTPSELRDAVQRVDNWYDDHHGSPDWRREVSTVLAAEVLQELGAVRGDRVAKL